MARNHFIEVKNLVKNYGTGNIKVTAVDNVSFYVDRIVEKYHGDITFLYENDFVTVLLG
ncbi:hypothetical protein C819_02103 [Lachnospiraceae bacterium 10-1]|nr:hypothetical protein C819_02103 [Lachnospiraceae bacterium 10-1]